MERVLTKPNKPKPPVPAETTAAHADNQPRARDVVTVGCKMPNGMILRLHKKETFQVPVLGGGTRDQEQFVPTGDQVTIHGPATPFGKAPRSLVAGGFALTPNVDRAFMRAWMEQNKTHDAVKNGLIFVQDDQHKAHDQAEEMGGDVRTGLEPMHPDPRKDARTPRTSSPNLQSLERVETPAIERASTAA